MDRYICTALDVNEQCVQWEPVGLTVLTVEQHAALAVATLLVLATAFGFRVLFRFLITR